MRPHAGKAFVARPFVAAYSNNFIRLPRCWLGKDISSEVRGEACEEEGLCGEWSGEMTGEGIGDVIVSSVILSWSWRRQSFGFRSWDGWSR